MVVLDMKPLQLQQRTKACLGALSLPARPFAAQRPQQQRRQLQRQHCRTAAASVSAQQQSAAESSTPIDKRAGRSTYR